MGILSEIKQESAKSGASKGKFIYFRENAKVRVRFLQELDDGVEVIMHDNYEKGINVPCREMYGKPCKYCDDEELRTRSLYAWSVYDYEAKEVKILMQAVNRCSAIPAVLSLNESYGTIMDRDLIITKTGKQTDTTFTVVPMDKEKFRNMKAKALSKEAILKYLDKAYPDSEADDNDEDDDEEQATKHSKVHTKSKRHQDEDDEDETPRTKSKKSFTKKQKPSDDDWEDEDDEETVDYTSMTAKELYKLCNDRDIDCEARKPVKYYINLLKEDDKVHDDWDDEEAEDDDEWEDE
jgi:hypothetical protein